MGENGEMGGKGVWRNAEPAGKFAGGDTLGLAGDETAENPQAGGLGQSGEGDEGVIFIHISGIMELLCRRKRLRFGQGGAAQT